MSVAITVIVPTFRRPRELARCLEGLAAQTIAPAQIAVVVNTADEETQAFLSERAPAGVEAVEVAEGGVLAALRAGVAVARGDWVAVLDDDSVPSSDWLERASHWFSDREIAGVGGFIEDGRGLAPAHAWRRRWAGKVTRLGLIHSSMTRRGGPPRAVGTDFLPGSNMLYRREALAPELFDLRMSFGIAPHFEADLGSSLRAAGWKLVYDPAVRVRHVPAPRRHALERGDRIATASAEAHNLVYHSLKHRGLVRSLPLVAFLALVGQRATPGLAFLARRPDAVRASLGGLARALGGVR